MRLQHSIVTAVLMLFAAVVATPAMAQSAPAKPVIAAPAPAKSEPVTPVCAACHEAAHASIALTHHGAKNDASGSMCQACHGDASEHMKDPAKSKPVNTVSKGAPAEKSAVCLTCHAGNRHLGFWESGKHAKNDVACSDCHNIHDKDKALHVAPYTTTSRPIEADTCGNCHKQVRNATLKPSHHPILEGKVKCSDCHNPHGALTQSMVKHETVNQQCFSCHADKRGPFVFGHPPVEENCLSCHTPHGSSHEKLLKEKAPNLCQDCHVTGRHPTSFYGSGQGWTVPGTGAPNASVSTRFIARGCLNCHNSIHGSNAPTNRGKFLIR
jgi:DmsE family decaheme c-type cytochrome